MLSFIEKQFPVSKVSKESYKERKANNGQTLTGLGKWWGRKPLVLVRATILGCLMPSSDNPKKDMDIFLKIMSMDDKGLELRKSKSFTAKEMYELAIKDKKLRLKVGEWFDIDGEKVSVTERTLIGFENDEGLKERERASLNRRETDKDSPITWF